jgi:hypothetical protein
MVFHALGLPMNLLSQQGEFLFHKADINGVINAQLRNAINEIQQIDPDRLLNTPVDDLIGYFTAKFRIEVPSLHRDRAVLDEPQETFFEVNDYGRQIRMPATLLTLTVPFDGEKQMFFVRPSQYDLGPPRAAVTSEGVVLRFTVRNSEQDRVRGALDGVLNDIERYLGWQRPTIERFNNDLPIQARQSIEGRRERLLRDRNLVSGLGFPVKPRANAPMTYAPPEVRRRIEPKFPPASTATFKPEPVLAEAHYKHILDVIGNMTLVMERSPSAFAEMGEENIRQHYLVQLNGHFEGAATGETFNHQGKTDILIRVDGKNIFIAECKFWRGVKQFTETVDQILSYLSWRDTKAAIILFNRNKDFSQVLMKIKEAMAAHPDRKQGPRRESETRFRYVFGNPSDHSREIILTVVAFDVPGT